MCLIVSKFMPLSVKTFIAGSGHICNKSEEIHYQSTMKMTQEFLSND